MKWIDRLFGKKSDSDMATSINEVVTADIPSTLKKKQRIAWTASLIARLGEQEYLSQITKNADGESFKDDTSFGKEGQIRDARFSPDGQFIYSCGRETLQTWASDTGNLLTTIPIEQGDFREIRFAPNGLSVACSGDRFTLTDVSTRLEGARVIILDDVKNGASSFRDMSTYGLSSIKLEFLRDPNRVLILGLHGDKMKVGIVDLGSNKIVKALDLGNELPYSALMSPSRNLLVVALGNYKKDDGKIVVLDVKRDLHIKATLSIGGQNLRCCFQADDDTLFIASTWGEAGWSGNKRDQPKGRIAAWHLPTQRQLWVIESSDLVNTWGGVTDLSAHPGEPVLAFSITEDVSIRGTQHSISGHIGFLDLDSNILSSHFKAHRNRISNVSYSCTGDRLLTVSVSENAMKIWNVVAG